MSDAAYRSYLEVQPPSCFLREATRVIVGFLVLTFLLFLLRVHFLVLGGNISLQHASLVDTIGTIDSGLAAAWFLIVTCIGASRIRLYRKTSRSLPVGCWSILYPLAACSLFSAALLASWLFYATEGVAHDIILTGSIPLLIGMDLGGLQRWRPEFSPRSIRHLLGVGSSVCLGPGYSHSLRYHIDAVLSFPSLLRKAGPDGARDISSAEIYSDSKSFLVFQKSLTSPVQTAPFVAALIRNRECLKGPWTLTDIGGGDGAFTSSLIDSLIDPPMEITVIEPSGASLEKYEARFKGERPAMQISVKQNGIEKIFRDVHPSEVLLASHSLYYVLDRHEADASTIVKRLISQANMSIFLMASEFSNAYTMKEAVLDRLNLPNPSTFGKDLASLIAPRPATHFVRDSLMDVSDLLTDRKAMLLWFSYFCRVPVSRLEPEAGFLYTLLLHTSIPKGGLPEALRIDLEKSLVPVTSHGSTHNDRRYVLHKEDIIITN